MVFPSLVIITAIAALLSNFADIPLVQHAFSGIRVAVVVLIFNSVLKLIKGAVKDYFALGIFLLILLLALFTDIGTVYLVVISAILGIVINTIRKGKEAEK